MDPYAINNRGNFVGQENLAGVYQAFLHTPPGPGESAASFTGFVSGGTATAISDTGYILIESLQNHVLDGIFPGFADLGSGAAYGINDAGQTS